MQHLAFYRCDACLTVRASVYDLTGASCLILVKGHPDGCDGHMVLVVLDTPPNAVVISCNP